jgi:hypothetical protein
VVSFPAPHACRSCLERHDVVPRTAHPGDRRSAPCGMVCDGRLKGGRSVRRARALSPSFLAALPAQSRRSSVAPHHRSWRLPPLAAGAPLAGAARALSNPWNRVHVIPRPLPHPPWPGSGETSSELGHPAPATDPRDYIAKKVFFSRASLQKCNSNSKSEWLILVNCVENQRKITKLWNQFCWVRCELYYSFCYSGLS